MAEVAMHLTDNVLPFVPVRQWVLSVPWALRRRRADRSGGQEVERGDSARSVRKIDMGSRRPARHRYLSAHSHPITAPAITLAAPQRGLRVTVHTKRSRCPLLDIG